MDRYLKPDRLDVDPNSADAAKSWKHWKKTFDNFLASFQNEPSDKLVVLTNFVSPTVYDIIADCTDYDTACATLKGLYEKPINEIFARHLLATCKQEPGQTLDDFLQKLKTYAKDCNFKAVSAVQYANEAV